MRGLGLRRRSRVGLHEVTRPGDRGLLRLVRGRRLRLRKAACVSRQFWSSTPWFLPIAHRLLPSALRLSRSHGWLAGTVLEDEAERVAQRHALPQHLRARNRGHRARAAQQSRQVNGRTVLGGGVPSKEQFAGRDPRRLRRLTRPGAGAPIPAPVSRPAGAPHARFQGRQRRRCRQTARCGAPGAAAARSSPVGARRHTTRGRFSKQRQPRRDDPGRQPIRLPGKAGARCAAPAAGRGARHARRCRWCCSCPPACTARRRT